MEMLLEQKPQILTRDGFLTPAKTMQLSLTKMFGSKTLFDAVQSALCRSMTQEA